VRAGYLPPADKFTKSTWCDAFRSWRLARFNAGNEQTHLHVVVAVQQEVNYLLRCN
jgi:hypothetical protein